MRIEVTIEGKTALLMNRFTESSEVLLSVGTSAVLRGKQDDPRAKAEKKAYRGTDGALYVPAANILAMVTAAGVFTKVGKSKLTTQKTSLIPAGISIEGLVCPLTDHAGKPLKDFEVDSRSVVIPSTGGRVMCHRPRLDQWRLGFALDVDDEMFGADLVRQLVDDAGKKIGLGDFRPARRGPFGRFAVVRWEVVKQELRRVA